MGVRGWSEGEDETINCIGSLTGFLLCVIIYCLVSCDVPIEPKIEALTSTPINSLYGSHKLIISNPITFHMNIVRLIDCGSLRSYRPDFSIKPHSLYAHK